MADAWRTSGPLEALRAASARSMDAPLRFLVGGGDSDHSYTFGHTFFGADPYGPLYEQILLWLGELLNDIIDTRMSPLFAKMFLEPPVGNG